MESVRETGVGCGLCSGVWKDSGKHTVRKWGASLIGILVILTYKRVAQGVANTVIAKEAAVS